MMPQKGDITTPRNCDFCGHSLAEYRGVLEAKAIDSEAIVPSTIDAEKEKTLFFCNYEHQADFHAGKTY